MNLWNVCEALEMCLEHSGKITWFRILTVVRSSAHWTWP